MTRPSVYLAINQIMKEFSKAGIGKLHENVLDSYKYLSIDDILDRLSPLLAKFKLCIFPRVISRDFVERRLPPNEINVSLRVSFAIVSLIDGSNEIVEVYGEALDSGDKATAKAMTAAFKTAIIQTFCIPRCGANDLDSTNLKLPVRAHVIEPVQGWEQWSSGIAEMIGICETEEAVERVQERSRRLFSALNRERPDLYQSLGKAFEERRRMLLSSGVRAGGTNAGTALPESFQATVLPSEAVDG